MNYSLLFLILYLLSTHHVHSRSVVEAYLEVTETKDGLLASLKLTNYMNRKIVLPEEDVGFCSLKNLTNRYVIKDENSQKAKFSGSISGHPTVGVVLKERARFIFYHNLSEKYSMKSLGADITIQYKTYLNIFENDKIIKLKIESNKVELKRGGSDLEIEPNPIEVKCQNYYEVGTPID